MGDKDQPVSGVPESFPTGAIQGMVQGIFPEGPFRGQASRPFKPTIVFALIMIETEDKKDHRLFYPCAESQMPVYLKKIGVLGNESLVKDFPSAASALSKYISTLSPIIIDEDNAAASFEFTGLPLTSQWSYKVAALAGESVFFGYKIGTTNDYFLRISDFVHGPLAVRIDIPDIGAANYVVPTQKVEETDKDMDDPAHLKKLMGDL